MRTNLRGCDIADRTRHSHHRDRPALLTTAFRDDALCDAAKGHSHSSERRYSTVVRDVCQDRPGPEPACPTICRLVICLSMLRESPARHEFVNCPLAKDCQRMSHIAGPRMATQCEPLCRSTGGPPARTPLEERGFDRVLRSCYADFELKKLKDAEWD